MIIIINFKKNLYLFEKYYFKHNIYLLVYAICISFNAENVMLQMIQYD